MVISVLWISREIRMKHYTKVTFFNMFTNPPLVISNGHFSVEMFHFNFFSVLDSSSIKTFLKAI